MTDRANTPHGKDVLRAASGDPPNDAAMEELIQRAGRRPAVPDDVAAQVKAAAEAQWQWTLRLERRRRRQRTAGAVLAVAACVALVVGLLGRWPGRGASNEPIATVETRSGRLLVDGEELDSGSTVTRDARIETRSTVDRPGRALLRLAGGVALRLDTDTRLRLLGRAEVALEAGAVYVDTDASTGALTDNPLITVRTEHGIVRDIGTRFEVRTGDDDHPLQVRVRDGRIELERAGERRVADAGIELSLTPDGDLVETAIAPHDPAWSWTLDVLPSFDSEGRTLAELLDWLAHEGGWTVRYSDPRIEAEARALTLHGSIEGLGLAEALELTLLGTGLGIESEVEAGELWIRPVEE